MFFSSPPHKEGPKGRIKGSQDFFKPSEANRLFAFCAFTRTLTVVFAPDVEFEGREGRDVRDVTELV